MRFLEKVSAVISKYMALLVVVVAALALTEPWTFMWATPNITLLLGVAMFGMGMTLRINDFRLILQRPTDVLLGVLAQFIIMPLLAWCLVNAFNLPIELAIGVILVGTCPGGTSSNIMTYLSGGDVALSVSMTMATTVLAPVVTPLLTWWLAGEWIEIPLGGMMLSILKVVIIPISMGLILNNLFEKHIQRVVKIFPLFSILAVISVAGGAVAASSQRIMEAGVVIMSVVICHNLLGYCTGFLVAKACHMDLMRVKAISIEVGMQNSGLATTLALVHFGAAAAIPGALFSVWHNISGSLMANVLSGYKITKKGA